MKIKSLQLVSVFCFVLLVSASAEARYRKNPQVNKKWEEAADTNNNGYVGVGETKAFAKDHPKWRHHQRKVDKAWEQNADDDGDGFVNHGELKDLHDDKTQANVVTDTSSQ